VRMTVKEGDRRKDLACLLDVARWGMVVTMRCRVSSGAVTLLITVVTRGDGDTDCR